MITYEENALQRADYARLRASVGWLPFPDAQTDAALSSSLYDVVAVEDGQVVGMVRLIGDGIYNTVVDVVVEPEHQGGGVGRTLVSMVLQFARKTVPAGGRTSLQLIAATGKEGFYKKFGFEELPCAHTGAGMKFVIFGEGNTADA